MISFIVPVYNKENDLEKCLNSIRNQTYEDIEVILINDGSKDGSEEICLRFAEQDPRFKYFYQDNAGVSAARNNGLARISGEYFSFVDSDDWIDATYCEKMLQTAIASDADMVFCGINYYESGEEKPQKETGLKEAVLQKHVENFLMGHRVYALGSACRILYKSDVCKQVRFNEKLHIYEDLTFMLACLNRSKSNDIVKEYLYTYNLPETEYFVKYYREDIIDICYDVGKILYDLLVDSDRVEYAKAELFKEFRLAVLWLMQLDKDEQKAQFKKLKNHKIIKEFYTKENYKNYERLYEPIGRREKFVLSLFYHNQFSFYLFLRSIKSKFHRKEV